MDGNLIYDVVFHSHASSLTGFGHASRCVKIASHLNAMDTNLKLGFTGSYSNNALMLMEKICPIDLVDKAKARVSFYDRMDDPERPQIYDKKLLDKVIANSEKIIFQANGLYPPDLPENVICVGYKPNDLTSQRKMYFGVLNMPQRTLVKQVGVRQKGSESSSVAGGRQKFGKPGKSC